MRKVIGVMTLAVGLGVLATSALSPVDAQVKDPKAKVDPKTKVDPKAKEAPAAGGTVEVYKAKDGYRFRIKNAEGKTIAMPPRGEDSEEDAIKVLEEVKATLNKVKPTKVKD